jgi:hypothetical protein
VPRGVKGREECQIQECVKPQHAQGWCDTHYKRWQKHGDPLWEVAPLITKNDDGVDGKICPKCSTWKLLSEFNRDRSIPCGFACWCRTCTKAKGKTFYDKNPDRTAIWRKQNPEYMAKWHEENREHIAEVNATWAKNNPDKRHASAVSRRARQRRATIEKFLRSEIYERDGWICQLCLKPIDHDLKWPDPGSPSVDHIIPLIKGGDHSRANVQATHLTCNLRKYDKIF